MLERLERLWARLRPDPQAMSLGWWMVAMHLAIVLIVGGGISYSAIHKLRELADDQGMARVQLGGAMAREDLRRTADDAVGAARSLAERPTLARLLAEGRMDALAPLLRRSCEAAGLDACAVVDGSQLVARSGPALDWDSILTASKEQGDSFLALPANARTPVLGAFSTLGDAEGPRVFIVRLMGDKLARALSQQVGLQIRLVDYRSFTNDPVNAFTPLYSASLTDGRSAAQRIDSEQLYAASVPLFASTGEAIALIEARLPTEVIDTSEGRLVRNLLITTAVLAGLAVLAGYLLGERVTAPIRALTTAAVRLGEGDFSASIPKSGAAEVGALARTMEDMRRNLVELTGALRRREAEARAVLGGVVEGVYAVDRHRQIRYLNPQAERLLGVKSADVIGKFCGDVLKPRAVDGRRPCDFRCPILQARLETSSQAVEHLQVGDYAPRTTLVTSADIVDGLQVQVIRDETELEAVRRARDSVLANISHEFRTPLAAQLASIELLMEGLSTLEPAQQQELVRSLERGTLRLTRLIDNLLESVRIESGQLAIRHQSVLLADVVEDARSLVDSLLALRRQRLEVLIPEDLPLIVGDAPRLTQVFVNLLANANKFAPEDSAVRIGAEAHDGRVHVWVEDEGPGPDMQHSEALFARFQRGAEAEPEPGGLGLGLWIVKSIIDRHSGTIALARTADRRTRLLITLPSEDSES